MFAHGTRHDDAGSGPTEHPELEEIAALVDGRLPAPRAERLRSHLASCAECREVFLETVDFVREEEAEGREADQPPFEDRSTMTPPIAPRPPAARWLPAAALAAAAVMAVGIGLSVHQRSSQPPTVNIARLAVITSAPAQQQRLEASGGYYDPRPRGDAKHQGTDFLKPSFQLGVNLANLRVAAEGNNWDVADSAAAKINGVNDFLGSDSAATKYFKDFREFGPTRLRSEVPNVDRMIGRYHDKSSLVDHLYLDFGMWAEAGHLASAAQLSDFLTSRDHERFPEYLRGQIAKDGGELGPEVDAALTRIEKILGHDRLSAGDYQNLKTFYENVLNAYAWPVD